VAEAETLLELARALLPRSAARYSRFRVAAMLESEDGEGHPGVNVESVSYGLSMCAERNALFGAIARGETRFLKLALVSETMAPVLPCGACRQLLLEYAPGLVLVVEHPGHVVEEIPLASLLPRAFTRFEAAP
jgi:homotetrameric cytidine deaminase